MAPILQTHLSMKYIIVTD